MVEKQTRGLNQTAASGARGIGRRALLTGLGAGDVSAAAMAAAGSVPRSTPDRPKSDGPAPSETEPVYRETDHIREFYARSRF